MMYWKDASSSMPRMNQKDYSAFDLLIWDGKEYHRGFASWVGSKIGEPPIYWSYRKNGVVSCLKFLEIETVTEDDKYRVFNRKDEK